MATASRRPPAGGGTRNNSAYKPSFDGVISALRAAIRACEGTKVTYFPHDRNGIVEFREDVIKIKRGVMTRVRRVYILEHRYKVGWVVDADFNNCMLCYREFGWYRGRPKHHCRACGALVCHDCSPYLTNIPYVEEDKNGSRVCRNCFGLKPGIISPMSTASMTPTTGMNPEASMYYVPPTHYDLVVPPTALFTSPAPGGGGGGKTDGVASQLRITNGGAVPSSAMTTSNRNMNVPSSAIQGSVQGTINGKVRRRTKLTPKREAEDSLIRKYIEEMAKFEAEQKPKYEEAYRKMRELVPVDIHKSSLKGLIAYGIPEEAATRIWNTKILWLIVTHPDDIAKIHLADFRSKYNFDGLDIVEMRAVWNILPTWNMESENPLERGKSEWKDGFKSKMDDIVYKEVRGTLATHIQRNPAYEEADFLHLFDPEVDIRPRFHRSASFFNEATESPMPNGQANDDANGHDDDSYGLSPLLMKSPIPTPGGQAQRRMSVQDRQKMYMDNFKSPNEEDHLEKKEKKFRTLLEEINQSDDDSNEEGDGAYAFRDGYPSPIPPMSSSKPAPATSNSADEDDISTLGGSFDGVPTRSSQSYRNNDAQTPFPPSSSGQMRNITTTGNLKNGIASNSTRGGGNNGEEALTPVPSPQHQANTNTYNAGGNSPGRPRPAPLTRYASASGSVSGLPPAPPSPMSSTGMRPGSMMRSQSLNFNSTTRHSLGAVDSKLSQDIPVLSGGGDENAGDSRYSSFSTISSVSKGGGSVKLQYVPPTSSDSTSGVGQAPSLSRGNSFRGSSLQQPIASPNRRGMSGGNDYNNRDIDDGASYGSYREDFMSKGLQRANSERFTSSTNAPPMSQSYNATSPLSSNRPGFSSGPVGPTPRTRETSIKPVQFPTITPRNAGAAANNTNPNTTGGRGVGFGGVGISTSEKVLSPYSVESLQSTSEAFYTPYHQHRMATVGSDSTGNGGGVDLDGERLAGNNGANSTMSSIAFTSVGSPQSFKFLNTSRDFGKRMSNHGGVQSNLGEGMNVADDLSAITPQSTMSSMISPMGGGNDNGLFTAVSSASKSPMPMNPTVSSSAALTTTDDSNKTSMNMNKLFDEIPTDDSTVPPPPSAATGASPSLTPSGQHKKIKKAKPPKETVISAISQGDVLQVITLLHDEPVNSILTHEEVLDLFWDCAVRALQFEGDSETSIQLQDMILFLIDDGSINVNNSNIVSGESLLHLVVTSTGFERLGRELIKRGADILLMDNEGNCPLSLFLLQDEEDWLLDEFESSGKEMKLLAFGSTERKLRYISYFILTGQSIKARELIGSGHIKITSSEATELMNSCRGNFENMTDPVDTFELLSSLGAELEV